MFKKGLLLILFLAAVTIYAVALFWSIQDYEEWKKVRLEEFPPEIRPFVDFSSYDLSKQGSFMILLGTTIGFAWLMAVVVLGRYHAKKAGIDKPEKEETVRLKLSMQLQMK